MFKKHLIVAVAMMAIISPVRADVISNPIVLELYTSQGCSSCPPADALLKRLSAGDPSLLPLSFHVHYWDYLGWKDPYSSVDNTNRQNDYAAALGARQVFTPQLIVNGGQSMVGSDPSRVESAIADAKKIPDAVNVSLTPDSHARSLKVVITSKTNSTQTQSADIWEIHYNSYAKTRVGSGENSGSTLENINNVTSIRRLGLWDQGHGPYTVALNGRSDDNIAVIVQARQLGQILGAAAYQVPK